MRSRLVWAETDIGLVRKSNEDRFAFAGHVGAGQARESCVGEISVSDGWAVVADGMGGHEAGEVASRIVVETMEEVLRGGLDESRISAALMEANLRVFAARGTGGQAMGSTIVGISFNRNECTAFNIGDSRLYLRRRGSLVQISVDDTPGGNAATPLLRNHSLTQSLGGTRTLLPLAPHIRTLSVFPEDQMLLSSDGLSDMLSDDAILQIWEGNSHDPARMLVAAAIAKGGRDNVTAVVIGPERREPGGTR